MQITLTWQTIITASAVLASATALIVAFSKGVRWYDRQKEQDKDLKALHDKHDSDMSAIKQEQTLMVYGVLACLKGLKEQGCNGPVTEAIDKIEKHLNKRAHE